MLFICTLGLNVALCDVAESWQFGIQDPATPNAEGMIFFHNYLMLFLTTIGIGVCYLLYYIIVNFNSSVNPQPIKFSHSSKLEIIWTIIPAISLVLIAIPSFNLLYSLDELLKPSLTLKVIGHQWYWSYEYSDFYYLTGDHLAFDSYMIKESELDSGTFRLLEVTNRVVLPIKTHIRLLVTAADVLHSWAIPSFGLKIDACPGRLNEVAIYVKRKGTYYGQCSEICGINHGFMPIVVRATSTKEFIEWFFNHLESNA